MAQAIISDLAYWENLADDRAFLHAFRDHWASNRPVLQKLLQDEWFCLRTVGTMRWFLTQEPDADPALVADVARNSLQRFGVGFLQAMFMGREQGQQLAAILSARRLGKTGFFRGLQFAASDGNRDAEIVLQWFAHHGSWWESTRAHISLESVQAYLDAQKESQDSGPQYPDLIPVENFKDFRGS